MFIRAVQMINIFISLFVFNFTILIFIKKIISIYDIFDLPDSYRKIHKKKISKIGGLIIFLNLTFYLLFSLANNILLDLGGKSFDLNLIIILGSFIFFLMGYFDDKYELTANTKMFLQIIFLLIVINLDNFLILQEIRLSIFKTEISLGNFSIILTIFCFLLFINALNMFDGINLQVGLYCLIVFSFLFIKTFDEIFIFLFFGVIIFLLLNLLKISFLGNSGAYFLGFLISALSIKFYNMNIVTVEEIVIFMLIPGLDMLRLALFRMANKKHLFLSDTNHIHHLLLFKYNLFVAILVTQSLILLPIILGIVTNHQYYFSTIIITTLIYVGIVYLLVYKK
jgi:UDP-GlcNAc:undecaprenyl-phosphate GlcNAc-1-phosphate transferase